MKVRIGVVQNGTGISVDFVLKAKFNKVKGLFKGILPVCVMVMLGMSF